MIDDTQSANVEMHVGTVRTHMDPLNTAAENLERHDWWIEGVVEFLLDMIPDL